MCLPANGLNVEKYPPVVLISQPVIHLPVCHSEKADDVGTAADQEL